MLRLLWISFSSILLSLFGWFGGQSDQPIMDTNFDQLWAQVDSLANQRLPESALKKVETIYDLAKAENADDHLLKAILFKARFLQQTEENGLKTTVNFLNTEYAQLDGIPKAVLASYLGELYGNYLAGNRYSIQQRTRSDDPPADDIDTWTIEQLLVKTQYFYRASLNEPSTKNADLANYKTLVTFPNNQPDYYPTLFDLLAARSVEFLGNTNNYLPETSYAFRLTDVQAFAESKTFVNADFSARDTASQVYQTILLFQEWERHQTAKNSTEEARTDLILRRLAFVRAEHSAADKDQRYRQALEALNAATKSPAAQAHVLYALGQYWSSESNMPTDAENRYYPVRALEYYQQAVENAPKSYGGQAAQQEIYRLETPILSAQTEQVYAPADAYLALIEYRHLQQLEARYYQLTAPQEQAFRSLNQTQKIEFLNSKSAVKTQDFTLPKTTDYRNHEVELALNSLPFGKYHVLWEGKVDADIERVAPLIYSTFQVSNLAYFTQQSNSSKSIRFFAVDRTTGKPQENVEIDVFRYEDNKKKRVSSKKTGKDGSVVVDEAEYQSFWVVLRQGKDVLDTEQSYYVNRYRDSKKRRERTHFFTDRSIYRPGQTVFFKAILFETDEANVPKIRSNQKVTITFSDVQNQKIEQLELRSNSFGSVSGSFTAPADRLLGQMSLQSNHGNNRDYLRVEEYKRPTFEVELLPNKAAPQLMDTVQVEGKALAYAGYPLSDAEVRYRVVRTVRYPWLPWYFRPAWSGGTTAEIAQGTTTTDQEGKFTVTFQAQPAADAKMEQNPVFNYEVIADVVDLNGETRSATATTRVGAKPFQIDLPLSPTTYADGLDSLPVQVTNLNGQPIQSTGTLEIIELNAPDRLFIDRYWSAPDSQLMNESSFHELFPNFAYEQEDEIQNFPQGKTVLSTDFSGKTPVVELPKNWKRGAFLVRVNATNEDGQTATYETRIFLQENSSSPAVMAALASAHLTENTVKVDEVAAVSIHSALKELHTYVAIEKQGKLTRRGWEKVKKPTLIKDEVGERDRGNYQIHAIAVALNRTFQQELTVSVPWDNKELAIEWLSIRDKMEPGEAAAWRLKISGPQGDAVAAELVAGMYDASLDAITPHNWSELRYPNYYSSHRHGFGGFGDTRSRNFYNEEFPNFETSRTYPALNTFDLYLRSFSRGRLFYAEDMLMSNMMEPRSAGAEPRMKKARGGPPQELSADSDGAIDMEAPRTMSPPESPKAEEEAGATEDSPTAKNEGPAIRENLNETVFFFPELLTDSDGEVVLEFKNNEALTKWNLFTYAHTPSLQQVLDRQSLVTQKEVMVQPNAPRFFREGDQFEFAAKAVNLTENELSGTATLEMRDALNGKLLALSKGMTTSITIPANQSIPLAWAFTVPKVTEVSAIEYTVLVQVAGKGDGERAVIPVLTNRMLVTESIPLPIRPNQKKVFSTKELNTTSKTLEPHQLTLEMTSNPAWYAVQALPYLIENPYDCSEQIFARLYANTLATSVANRYPRTKAIFEQWRNQDSDALLSNLEKNQELKSALLKETPWVLAAQNETAQKKRIGLLFDLNKMSYERNKALTQLKKRQSPNGGFAWFPGGKESWYITQYIVAGMGHLDHLNALDASDNTAREISKNALAFCDQQMFEYYTDLKDKGSWQGSSLTLHYLYSRSFFKNAKGYELNAKHQVAFDYFMTKARENWTKTSLFEQGLLALVAHRYGHPEAQAVVASLGERALQNEELGRYYEYRNGFYWNESMIETHALLIEVMHEVAKDAEAVSEMKIWLLKNKQTNDWKTTTATAKAIYALLATGDNWLVEEALVDIDLPQGSTAMNTAIDRAKDNAEAGTGYYKHQWNGAEIDPKSIAEIVVSNPNKTIAWGAAYWQYFEDIDQVDFFKATPLTLKKELFKVVLDDRGERLEAITDQTKLLKGDKIKVRLLLQSDRNMEYLHLKDLRPANLEPMSQISSYQWQDGLGYYESPSDLANNYFISYLPKGNYVFEYEMRVFHTGNCSGGVASIQCMYAPEFTSHSSGGRLVTGE